METAVVKANEIISAFISGHNRVLSSKPWYEYRTYVEVEESLRLHRLRKKFCIIDEADATTRRDESIAKFLKGNEARHLARSALYYHLRSRTKEGSFLARARELVHSLFRRQESMWVVTKATPHCTWIERKKIQSYAFWERKFDALPVLEMGPGEQVISSGGDVSTLAKIWHHRWTCTPRLEKLAKKSVRADRQWRQRVYREGLAQLRKRGIFRDGLSQSDWKNLCFEIGWKRVVHLTRASRLTTVPKNNEVDRVINVEPLLNIGVQKHFGQMLSIALKQVGIDLERGQSLHQKLIQSLTKATIDFSAASDSYGPGLVEFLFPEFVYRKLMLCRSGLIEINGETRPLNVYGCMGNGTTFPVLTTIVWALASAAQQKHAWAYGDDLICEASSAKYVIHKFSECGFTVNTDKSFMDGKIRESCGAFTYDGKALRTYDIKACETIADIIHTANKVLYYVHCSPWKYRWTHLWAKLASLVPEYGGPIGSWETTHEVRPWLEVPGFLVDEGKGLLKWFHEQTGRVCVITHMPVWEQGEVDPDVPELGMRCERLRTLSQPIRHVRGAGVYKDQSIVVSEEGQLIGTVKELRLQRTKWIEWQRQQREREQARLAMQLWSRLPQYKLHPLGLPFYA